MIITLPRNKKKIFGNKNNLRAELLNIEIKKDEAGNKEKIYQYNVHVEIDKKEAIKRNLQKIEIYLKREVFKKHNNREKVFDNINTKLPYEINLLAINAERVKFNQTLNLFNNLKMIKVGEISSDDVFDSKTTSKIKSNLISMTDIELFGKKTSYRLIEKENDYLDQSKDLLKVPFKKNGKKIDLSKKFAAKYTKFLNSGIDPAKIISKSAQSSGTQSLMSMKKGRMLNLKKPKLEGTYKILNETLQNNSKNVETIQSVNNKFSLQKFEESNRYSILSQKISLTQRQIQKIKGGNIPLFFIAIDKKGSRIEYLEGVIKHSEEKEKINFPKFDFEIDVNKTALGNVCLKIINNEKEERIFNVYSRQLSDYLPQELIKYELIKPGVKVPGKSSIILFNKGNYFKKIYPVFFRVNLIHDKREYSNSKFASITSGRKLNPINYAGLSAIIQNDRIAIQVRNISSSIKKLELYRKDISKKEKTFTITKSISIIKNKTKDLIRNKGIHTNSNIESIYTFYDDDVEYGHTYEYKALLFDDNGNPEFSMTSAIERYGKPSGLVEIIVNKKLINNNIASKTINLSGNVNKKENDADKLFKDLFGRYYDMFSNDLNQIKDLNGITINILVELINRDNSEVSRLGEINVDEKGEFNKSFNLPENYNYAIKLTPRVLPPAEILTKINQSLTNLAAKNRFTSVSSFNQAAIKSIAKQKSRNILSTAGDKFSQRNNRMKGKITDNKTYLNQANFDMYYDGDTGDVVYLLEDKFKFQNTTKNECEIELLTLDNDTESDQISKNNRIKKEYYLSNFKFANQNDDLDFLLMMYEENGKMSIAGTAFIPNSNINVIYVFETPVLYGKINFFAQPVYKNGNISSHILLKTIYKDDEGIK